MMLSVERDTSGRLHSVHYETERRYAWIGRTGVGFGNGLVIHNSHWYDLQHPWRRYTRGSTRFAFFWAQLRDGLVAFFQGTANPDD